MFYGRTWLDVNLEAFMDIVVNYIRWYNEARIMLSLGGMILLKFRGKFWINLESVQDIVRTFFTSNSKKRLRYAT